MDTGGNHKVTMAIVHAIFALCGGVVREMTRRGAFAMDIPGSVHRGNRDVAACLEFP